MAIIKTRTTVDEYDELVVASIESKEKNVKLDNLLTTLNLKGFEIDKIKVDVVKEKSEEVVHYGQPKVNELFVLDFKDVNDIDSFKVKGRLNGNKFCIIENFIDNELLIKVVYGPKTKSKDIDNILRKY